MTSLRSLQLVEPPTTVRTLARSVFMSAPISLRELMRRLEAAAAPRPFYIIAHRCNDLDAVKAAVKAGANTIECDIQFPAAGTDYEFAVDHDHAFTGRPIKPYLDGLAKILAANPQVALVYFDIKDSDADRAVRLREIIRTHLTDVVPVNVILSQAAFASRGFFLPIKSGLRPREAYAIDEHDDPRAVQDFFLDNGITSFCYGNGVFVTGVPVHIPRSIMEGVALKWSERKIRWVCTWTLAEVRSLRDYLAKGVDGIMVNQSTIAALKNMVAGEFKGKLRLATRMDNPFEPPVHPSYVLTVKTASGLAAGTDAYLTFELRGSNGKLATTIDAFPVGLFESAQTDRVTLIGKDVGTIQELVLSQDGSGSMPDWSVETVQVQKSGSATVSSFHFNQEIRPGAPVSRKPG